jgi:hypothetical protein
MIITSLICRLMVSAVLVVVTGSLLYAQSPTVSIGGGYERGQASMEFTDIDSCCREDQFENGVDQVSAIVAYAFPLAGVTIEARALWTGSDVLFTTTFPRVRVLIPGHEGLDHIQEGIQFSMQTLQLELLCRVSVMGNLSIAGGPMIGYRSISDYEHWQINLDDYSRPPNRRWFIQDRALESMNHIILGALVTAEYDVLLSQQFSLVPEIRLRGDFTSPFANTNWNLFSAGGALSIRYSL